MPLRLLSNYSPAPRFVALAAGRPVRILAVIARAPTLLASGASASDGRARLELPANSLVAITTAAG